MTENKKMNEIDPGDGSSHHSEESIDNTSDNTSLMQFTEQRGMLVISRNWTDNYIIVEKIMYALSWQDQIRCSHVCRLWREIVTNLRRKNLSCYDYALVKNGHDKNIFLDTSISPVTAKPLICFSFALNFTSTLCENLSPPPCKRLCKRHHNLSDCIERKMLCRGDHHISVSGFPMIYEPLSTSNTYQYTVHGTMKTVLGGLQLPVIPGVSVNIIHYRKKSLVKDDVYREVDYICGDSVIKGVVVFVEERMLLIDNEKLKFIKYFFTKQEEPFALGGCVVGSVTSSVKGRKLRTNGQNSVTAVMVVFSVPRRPPCPAFEMHSLLLRPHCQSKASMKGEVQVFADQVPKTQYSACLKLSCIGRDAVSANELAVFREAFPRTTVVGCFGNGEIGHDHPKRFSTRACSPASKSLVEDSTFSYTYCTVFVLFSWGKILEPGKPSDRSQVD